MAYTNLQLWAIITFVRLRMMGVVRASNAKLGSEILIKSLVNVKQNLIQMEMLFLMLHIFKDASNFQMTKNNVWSALRLLLYWPPIQHAIIEIIWEPPHQAPTRSIIFLILLNFRILARSLKIRMNVKHATNYLKSFNITYQLA